MANVQPEGIIHCTSPSTVYHHLRCALIFLPALFYLLRISYLVYSLEHIKMCPSVFVINFSQLSACMTNAAYCVL